MSVKMEFLQQSKAIQLAILQQTYIEVVQEYTHTNLHGNAKQGLKMLIDGLRSDIWRLKNNKEPRLTYLT